MVSFVGVLHASGDQGGFDHEAEKVYGEGEDEEDQRGDVDDGS